MAYDDELPQHTLYLPEYRIARVPVTNEEYKQFVVATKHQTPSHWERGRIPEGKNDHPVVNVSWHDAMAFCKWAGVALPNEAEWEKAARGEQGAIWPWGDEPPTAAHCNFDGNVGDTTPVGRYPDGVSPYDLTDMAGNVWEWTSSAWGDYPYDPSDGREQEEGAAARVVRGGSFLFIRRGVRCASRFIGFPDDRDDGFGFRICWSPGP